MDIITEAAPGASQAERETFVAQCEKTVAYTSDRLAMIEAEASELRLMNSMARSALETFENQQRVEPTIASVHLR